MTTPDTPLPPETDPSADSQAESPPPLKHRRARSRKPPTPMESTATAPAPAADLEPPVGGTASSVPAGAPPSEPATAELPVGGATSPAAAVAPAARLEPPASAAPAPAAAAAVGVSATDALRAEAAAAVQELEVEIRNQPEGAGTRDLAAEALRLIRENLARLSPPALQRAAALIRENVLSGDYLDPDFWRGIGMVLRYQAEETSALVQRRLKGEYTLDAYGMDQELIDIVRPFAAFLYRTWWRVTAEGLAHIPAEGPALLVANHSGVLPWDSAMIATAVLEDHPQPRLVRSLHASWLGSVPVMAPALAAFGQVPALPENAERLLGEGQLVCAFPEGARGAGKLFWNRYRLAAFDAAGYVQAALRTGAPIVPVAVIGAEEIYPVVADARPVARLLGFPFFPLTPLFPWLGPLGLIPLPSKWTIIFDAPIATRGLGPNAADDPASVQRLAGVTRARIQALLDERVPARKSVFFGR
ncbi:MAG TPA: lysophospholipid acyltransferase family protein [Roseiflexaceae bacterium]|nr:lysophospholipid acyltransferase family protein [Roseiflexaceae bacterium]